LTHPHDPFAIPERWWKLYGEDEIPLPRVPLGKIALHPHEERLWRVCDMDSVALTQDQARSARRAYYGADITAQDVRSDRRGCTQTAR